MPDTYARQEFLSALSPQGEEEKRIAAQLVADQAAHPETRRGCAASSGRPSFT